MKNLFAMLVCINFCGLQSANAQSQYENTEAITQAVAQFLTDAYIKDGADNAEVKVNALDSRLRLAQCDKPLSFSNQDTSGNGGNVNVQVACKGITPWTILTPAQAKVYRSIAVASRTLQRGQVVTEADLQIDSTEMSQYRQGFIVNKDEILGKEIRYPINKGDAFRTSVLDAPIAIKRGDEVSIEATVGSIRVMTNGTAISDGRLGQQIRVKNNQSSRIVNAKVLGSGKVQTIL